MPSFSFKRQFVPAVWLGLGKRLEELPPQVMPETFIGIEPKRQTIRAARRRGMPRVGDLLHLFFGLRTQHCWKLGIVKCTFCEPITLDFQHGIITIPGRRTIETWEQLEHFARQDGFDGWREMRRFWKETHEANMFNGYLIEWSTVSNVDL